MPVTIKDTDSSHQSFCEQLPTGHDQSVERTESCTSTIASMMKSARWRTCDARSDSFSSRSNHRANRPTGRFGNVKVSVSMPVVCCARKYTFDISPRMRQAQIIAANWFKCHRLNELLLKPVCVDSRWLFPRWRKSTRGARHSWVKKRFNGVEQSRVFLLRIVSRMILLVGLFVQTVDVRNRFDRSPTFRLSLATCVRELLRNRVRTESEVLFWFCFGALC